MTNVTLDARENARAEPKLVNFDITDSTSELDMFIHLLPLSIALFVSFTNAAASSGTAPVAWKPVTMAEMWVFIGLFIARSLTPMGSRRSLWPSLTDSRRSLFHPVDFSKFMTRNRFENILRFFSVVDSSTDRSDDWWQVRGFVDAFNANRKANIKPGWCVVIDELMSAWRGASNVPLPFFHSSETRAVGNRNEMSGRCGIGCHALPRDPGEEGQHAEVGFLQ